MPQPGVNYVLQVKTSYFLQNNSQKLILQLEEKRLYLVLMGVVPLGDRKLALWLGHLDILLSWCSNRLGKCRLETAGKTRDILIIAIQYT